MQMRLISLSLDQAQLLYGFKRLAICTDLHKSYAYFMQVLWFYFWWTMSLRSSTHTPTQRITVIHSWIASFFHSPWEVHIIFHLLDIGSFLQQTGSLTTHGAPLSLLAGATRPWSSHCYCEWENSLQLLFDLFWLWRKVYRAFVVIFGPARLDCTQSKTSSTPNSTSVCLIISHVIFIPPVWESYRRLICCEVSCIEINSVCYKKI